MDRSHRTPFGAGGSCPSTAPKALSQTTHTKAHATSANTLTQRRKRPIAEARTRSSCDQSRGHRQRQSHAGDLRCAALRHTPCGHRVPSRDSPRCSRAGSAQPATGLQPRQCVRHTVGTNPPHSGQGARSALRRGATRGSRDQQGSDRSDLPYGYEFMYGSGPGPSDRQRSRGVPRVPQPTLWVLIAPLLLPAAGVHAAEQ